MTLGPRSILTAKNQCRLPRWFKRNVLRQPRMWKHSVQPATPEGLACFLAKMKTCDSGMSPSIGSFASKG